MNWRRYLLNWWFAAAVLSLGILLIPGLKESVPTQVSGEQTDFYIALSGVSGALMGFLVAAITFLASLPTDRPLLQRLAHGTADNPSLLHRTLTVFGITTISLGVLTIASLLGILIDRQPETQLASGDLGAGAYWIWVVLLCLFPAAVRFGSCVFKLNEIARASATR